jgi:UPF0755 protein
MPEEPKSPDINYENDSVSFTLDQEPEIKRTSFIKLLSSLLLFAVLLTGFGLYLFSYLQTPPANFASGSTFVIESGSPTKLIVNNLKSEGFVRSEFVTLVALRLSFPGASLKAGTYSFTEPLTVTALLAYLIAGDPKSDLLRLTFIEGESAVSYGRRAATVIPDFDTATFIDAALLHEGKLFPETYLVPKNFTATDLLTVLLKTFEENVADFSEEIAKSSLTLEEIIILASIVEREANTEESMRLVAGILQNRLAIGMALQVDASMEYVLDKPLSELTPADLELDTPYNTYLYPGLPPTAIGNPGLLAIDAVLNPTPSKYFFYITGNDGNFYYAEDFDQHRLNIQRYLR